MLQSIFMIIIIEAKLLRLQNIQQIYKTHVMF